MVNVSKTRRYAALGITVGIDPNRFSGWRNPASSEFAPEPWDRKEGSCRWKLLHREQRPALERDIIDASEWTWANDRYVMGQYFGL